MVNLRRAAVVLAVLLLVLAVGGSFAVAKKKKKQKKPKSGTWDSAITLVQTTPTHFEGAVSSTLDACRNQRYVVVFYAEPSTGQVSPFSVQRTDSTGRYMVNLPKPAFIGGYSAQVSEERISANNAPQTCKGAASPPFTVSG